MPARVDKTLRLGDGRGLAYTEWGDPDGRSVLFFHGTPHRDAANAQLTVWPDAGHIGLAKHWREILDDVIAH
ncbi:MAG: hypothetical protein M3R39_09330 [Actinomycetota bacterium]|nr:hypothetical protein [Actinomycetota bacterium]